MCVKQDQDPTPLSYPLLGIVHTESDQQVYLQLENKHQVQQPSFSHQDP